ncbi:MAG: FAD-dependent oxidoreductase [Chloroflexi bacterium]|nr:FAD-dependent oxidoreductase [Chloroflexota bacterium]
MSDASNDNKNRVGAVMVVGGGIAGMQSSLDLANSGFKVFLVEETSAIGGRMSQLDKTFPTNDCSMCMISPKLIEIDKNLNIELLTNTRVQSVEGEEGDFTVTVLKKPRYIDLKKCTGCGDCAQACPVSLANEFEMGLNQRKATFKRYPQAIPSAFSITKAARPPCKLSCPAGCNGQGYVALISQGKYVEAVDHIKKTIPLPSTLGRICHHPCEQACNRGDVDQPIAIATLKSFVSDLVRQRRKDGQLPPEEKPVIDLAKPKVAVVGAGPSGITCAYELVKKGYPVTIFEAASRPGGQLQSSIPRYRLPKDVLADDIKDIMDSGIELKLNSPINDRSALDGLKKQGYQAVYLAIGAQKSRGLPIPGAELPGVLLALDFLRKANLDEDTGIGKRVVVIGGGNVAMDVARTARRLGAAEVHAVCLESRTEMPAHAWEIEEAAEEGVDIQPSWGPRQIIAGDGKVAGIEFEKCTAVFDSQKRFSPVFDKGVTQKFDCDTVIIAIGQAADPGMLEQKTGIKSNRGFIVADPLTLITGEPGVFAGGDAVTGPKSAVEAIQQGQEAAISIERYLTGQDLRQGRQLPRETPAPLPEGEHDWKPRVSMTKIALERRISGFDELEPGFTEEEALREARRCLNCGFCSECLQCVAACQAKAIDHAMKPETVKLRVGAVVLAPGFEPFDAALKSEYGYGRMPNVVTSLEFERILSASGPFQGQVKRPSDGKHPVKVAWIQCVGSRDETCGRDYCSSVCCMYATKEAIIAREHDSHIQPTIFYNDMRAFGKGFERYYESAKAKFGVRYVKSVVSGIKELQQGKNLLLDYYNGEGKQTEEFDMVVLSVGLVPSKSAAGLASTFGIKTDRFGFCQTEELSPNITSRPGVYVAGAFDRPMDIPEAVMSASSAASLAAQSVAQARGTLVTEKVYPPELELDHQAPRIGVFVCRCGTNIARVVDVPNVAEYAKTLPNVVHAEENLYTCSTDTQAKIIQTILEKKLNRVVVASCSPRTHEPLFQDTIRDAGLNKYLFDMANIRDQCSWVHATHMPEATDKARDLVRMAAARAGTLRPLHQTRADIKRKALVIGGGLSGMTAALSLAAQGFESALVERATELGGNLKHVHYTEDGADPQALLASLVRRVESEPRITVFKGAELRETSGFLGNYRTSILVDGRTEDIEHGVVILATGGVEYKPVEYLYGKSNRVLTQRELEEKLAGGGLDAGKLKSVVMVQCVGSREEPHMYCSRICCREAIKNALLLKKANPALQVYVLYRDIRTYGRHELKYREARDLGVTFIRYEVDRKPEVAQNGGGLDVRVFDSVLGTDIKLEPDLVVLSAGIRPQPDAEEFASKLKLPLTQDKFYMEAHMKLRPLDFVNDGMYLCGLAHSPKSIEESVIQARGAVARAMTVLSQPYLMVGGVVSVVDPTRCVACLTCVRSCPFKVPRINSEGVAYIEAAACQGCGICAGACPRKAITLQHYSDEQVMAKSAVLCAHIEERSR